MPLNRNLPSANSWNPSLMIHDASVALCFRRALGRHPSDNLQRAEEIEAMLERAMKQAGEGMDYSQCVEFGSDPSEVKARIVDANSELAGIEMAIANPRKPSEQFEVEVSERAEGSVAQWMHSDLLFSHERYAPKGLEGHEFLAAVFTTSSFNPEDSMLPGVSSSNRRRITLLSLIPVIPAYRGSGVKWRREDTFASGAAGKAENEAAAESTFAVSEQTSEFELIFQTLPVSEDILADSSQARRYLDRVIPQSTRIELDRQILEGTGSGNNELQGFKGIAGTTNVALEKESATDASIKDLADKMLDAKRILRNEQNSIPTHFVMNPTSFVDDGVKKNADKVAFYSGDPWQDFSGFAWGLPVVDADLLERGASKRTGLLLDLASDRIYLVMRQGFQTSIGYSGDGFIKREAVLRGLVRAVLIVERPSSVISLTQAA